MPDPSQASKVGLDSLAPTFLFNSEVGSPKLQPNSLQTGEHRGLLQRNSLETSNREAGDGDTRPQLGLFGHLAKFVWDSGVVCMFTAASLANCSIFCVKLLDGRVPVFQIVSIRALITFIAIILVQKCIGTAKHFGNRENYGKLTWRGLSGAGAMSLYYISVMRLPLGDAVTIFFTNAAALSLAAYLFGYEAGSWFIAAGCISSLGGVVMVAHPPFLFSGAHVSMNELIGVGAGLISATCAASAFLAINALGKAEKPIVVTIWFTSCSAIIAIPIMLAGYPSHAIFPSIQEWFLLSVIACTSGLGQLMLTRGFQLLPPSGAAAINLSQVPISHVLSIAFLGESIYWYSLAGSLLIGLGVILVQLGKKGANVTSIVDGEGARERASEHEVPMMLSMQGSSEICLTPMRMSGPRVSMDF